jgi:hypothetical protein
MESCQFCAVPTLKFGSIAKVVAVTDGEPWKPSASVKGSSGVFCTLRLFDSGDCCAIWSAIARYTDVSRYTPYPARTTSEDAADRHANPMRPRVGRTNGDSHCSRPRALPNKSGAMSRFTDGRTAL